VVFLYLAFSKVDMKETLSLMTKVKWYYLILAFILPIIGVFVRSYRWQIILHQNVPYKHFVEATYVGLFINNILPFRMGDFAQAYFLAAKSNLSKSTTFSTVVLERITDILPPFLILVVGSFFAFLPEQIGRDKIFIAVTAIFTILFFIIKFQKNIVGLIEKAFPNSTFGRKLHGFIDNLYSGMSFIKDPKRFTKVALLTLLLWNIYAFTAYSCILAFGIPINYLQTMLVIGVVSISVTIPSSPGYVGTWEFFSILALSMFKIGKSMGLSFALLYHLVGWLPITLIGFIIVLKSGMSLSKLEQSPEE